MRDAQLNVTFHGQVPDDIAVGDKLQIGGTVTIQGITAELVDVTSLGHDPQFLLGMVTVDLVANRLEVSSQD